MTPYETKAAIAAKLLEIGETRLFAPNEVVGATGLPRQTVNYHLGLLVKQVILEKAGHRYLLVQKDKLLELLLNSDRETANYKRSYPVTGSYLGKETVESLQEITNSILEFRSTGNTLALRAKQGMIEVLDETIKSLKQERNYLATQRRNEGSTRKKIVDLSNDPEDRPALGVEPWLEKYRATTRIFYPMSDDEFKRAALDLAHFVNKED